MTPRPPVRAVVLGLGPAGRIAAHRAAARGWDVLALDPSGGSMPSTVGAWVHQLPAWLPPEAVASRFRPWAITSDGRRRLLADDYAILDTGVLSGLGGFEVRREAGIGGVRTTYRLAHVASAEHGGGAEGVKSVKGAVGLALAALGRIPGWFRPDPDEGPSAHLIGEIGDCEGKIDDGTHFDALPEEWAAPDAVVDATPGECSAPVHQLAFGQVFDEADIPAGHREPVLMDFTVPAGAAADADGPGLPATFSYRLPLGGGRWLVEETILAAHVGEPPPPGFPDREGLHAHLRRMQGHRIAALGIDPAAAVDVEVVDFPLSPCELPGNRPRTIAGMALSAIPLRRDGSVQLDLGFLAAPCGGRGVAGHGRFGAAGGWMHPATGYSVGAVLADVDRFLARLGARGNANPPGGAPLAWLRRRGLHVLLSFGADDARAFFDAFFRLPDTAIREYLTGTTVTGTLSVMVGLAPALGRRSPATLGKLLAAFLAPKPSLRR